MSTLPASGTLSSLPAKAAIIIPYFGSWPSFFNVYLKGCAINPWLDVIFLTDCLIPTSYPNNVRFFRSSLDHISDLATEKLGVPIQIRSGYKLCDFRPFYGKIFEDYLTSHAYWGYGDIDLVYGDMAPFYLPKIEAEYDVISSRKVLLSGSFSLLKNTPYLKNLALNIPDYVQLLLSKKYEALDETGHSDIVWKGRSKLELPDKCFTYLVALKEANGELKASFEDFAKEHIDEGETIHFSSDLLLFNGSPLAYLHYVNSKGKNGFWFPRNRIVPDEFYITNTGFYYADKIKSQGYVSRFRKLKGGVQSIVKRVVVKLVARS